MNIFALMDVALIKKAMTCCCPKCEKGHLFDGFWSFDFVKKCDHCGLDLSKSDVGDGGAVVLIFVLGTILTPLAIWLEFAFAPPIWVHMVLWGVISIGLTLASIKPLKSYILGLQYKYRASDWDE